MKRIPDSQKVTKALREATKAVKESLHGLNQQAGQQMARGDYTGAEELASKGREIHAFLSQIESIQKDYNANPSPQLESKLKEEKTKYKISRNTARLEHMELKYRSNPSEDLKKSINEGKSRLEILVKANKNNN